MSPGNDNAPDTRITAPLRRDSGTWFAILMVLALALLGLWRGGAFG